MENIKKYFAIGTAEWTITVKWCVIIGFGIGLLVGAKILLNSLS